MYLVVSHWEVIPGHEEEFERIGAQMRDLMRNLPGTELMESFESNGKRVVIHGYSDEAAYNSIINDPNGPFAKAIAETHLEDHARWLSSERGAAIPHD